MKYYVVAYLWRRTGSADFYPANELHKGSLAKWWKETAEAMEGGEFVLLNAIPISAAEYKALDGQVG
jgi:hypothetical protein